MDFFKSVFADEPPESHESHEAQQRDEDDDNLGPEPEHHPILDTDSNKAWSFGGLIKTLATKSESVIQTYRHDLEEFGSGLKKETRVIRDVASRAVKDLPATLEVGAAVAQDSLESVGQAIDDIGSHVWKSTAGIINHGRDTLLAAEDYGDDSDSSNNNRRLSGTQTSDLKPYSRFEAQVRAIQSNMKTYLEEPEDMENYKEWSLGFVLGEKIGEIENLMKEDGALSEIYETVVPDKIDHESFWLRYFYRVHKLKEVEDARAKLVKRAISGEEEDLSWDFDDEDEDDTQKNTESAPKLDSSVETEERGLESGKKNFSSAASESSTDSDSGNKSEALKVNGQKENGDSSRDSDISVVSKPEEEDLGWDEIEDIGSGDENKVVDAVGSSNRADLRTRLSNAAEEDEDLSWDIDDDDEHSKS